MENLEYEKFFNDVKNWILECNSQAVKFGFGKPEFWDWAVMSLGELSTKYNNQPLVMAQTNMLLDWLEDTWEKMKNA